ncbi:MAG: FAD-dependent thymidylate synthase [Bdellovibrionota bacterium]
MKIELKASTLNIKSKQEALNFSRASARVCYSKYDFDTLTKEESQVLTEDLLNSGHHSPFEHVSLTFYITDIPKLGAMILNNEPPYVTSEKSARYTTMNLLSKEKDIYEKWVDIFSKLITDKYSFIEKDRVLKLAKENARNLTSVFTPTKMLYTTSFRQLNYLMNLFDDFIINNKDKNNIFYQNIVKFMKEFCEQLIDFREPRLNPFSKKRFLRLFDSSPFYEVFSTVYSTRYLASLSYLAQAQRHRTINYSMSLPSEFKFFMPPILESDELKKDWESDITSLKENMPQGMYVDIRESGTYFNFISKITERICGHAQLEIMRVSKQLLEKYIENSKETAPFVHETLLKYSKGARCTFPNIKCESVCPFTSKHALDRVV